MTIEVIRTDCEVRLRIKRTSYCKYEYTSRIADTPNPKPQPVDLTLTARTAMSEQLAKAKEAIQKEITAHKITVYSKTWCGYCKRTKDLLAGDEFKEFDIAIHEIDKTKDGPAIQKALAEITGKTSVPQVFVNGELLGGNDDTQAAYRSGKLIQKLKA
ncbi:glutaryl-CoA dehydrogenase [Nitzschia inconspicua]|uniref:Glutaryl-CoA dehydrogenase n=1 Tax=Nitzschia inconspicua TaxID=303405 RepID=A0A9K3Q2Q3_9STRA|nr:glutaryl-CoA dehydrogenase [Nitzschia inconspicua]